jgi:Zn-dependent M32 family carboxypeptidase
MNIEELKKKKVPELKKLLKDRNMKVSGNKSDLIQRLAKNFTIEKMLQKKDDSKDHVINLSGEAQKKLKLGNLIINIHNTLGGDPNNPYVEKVAKKADNLPPEEQKKVIEELKPHVEKAKKFPVVQPAQVTQKIDPSKVSAKSQKLQEKVVSELKQIKKAKGMDPNFKKTLEGLFGKK